jgi:predicted acetyltransferase
MAHLAAPHHLYKESYINALHEGFYRGTQSEKSAEDIKKIADNFDAYLQDLNDDNSPIELPTGEWVRRVPGYLYWMVDDHAFIGEASLRYELNDFLLKQGGHVGYGIRPSYQRRGYGSLALTLSLEKLKKHGLKRVLVTCDDENIASYKIIERNGGILEDIIPSIFHENHFTRRYWIDLKEQQ